MRAGFEPLRVAEQYDGQFLTIEARPCSTDTHVTSDFEHVTSDTSNWIRKFHDAYQKKVDSWQHTLSQYKERQARVVVWGAGSKGVTFLNALGISHEQVKYIVDLNPRKHGKFVPRTGHQVIAPGYLKDYRPQIVIVMNHIYHAEIRDVITDLGINAELIDA